MNDRLIVKGARVHNLKNIDVDFPKHTLVVISGVSGSGKSSLAFDTIYAEGQRRYIESLSAYARQFLNQLDKPDVDSIEGLAPAISIDQKSSNRNPRSTVGTVTEIYDYLRILFSSIGKPHCYSCGNYIQILSVQEITDLIMNKSLGDKTMVLSPLVQDQKGQFKDLLVSLKKEGFVRVMINGEVHRLDSGIELSLQKRHHIQLIVDRIHLQENSVSRLYQSIELAVSKSNGLVCISDEKGENQTLYSTSFSCAACEVSLPELSPRFFSFNSPLGACEGCNGLGYLFDFDEHLVFDNPHLAIRFATSKIINLNQTQLGHVFDNCASKYGFGLDTPYNELTDEQRCVVLYGQTSPMILNPYQKEKNHDEYLAFHEWEGVINHLRRRYFQTRSEGMRFYFKSFMSATNCSQCKGKRLNLSAQAVKVYGKSIVDLVDMSIEDALVFFKHLSLDEREMQIATQVLKEITQRLEYLVHVGLGYLTLSRSASTLSGGEFQRIRLATQIGSGLSGVLYVLDEPSIGLHQRDNEKLIEVLHKLTALGNTVVVVEHDEDTIKQAGYIIDIGPKAGSGGGELVFAGDFNALMKDKKSLTAQYLQGTKCIAIPKIRREVDLKKCLKICNAKANNLKDINVSIPLACFVTITGVSGSGKSTLVYDVLHKALMRHFYKSKEIPGYHREILGLDLIDKVVTIDQTPIGRTPRSNPITYTGIFSIIRELFCKTNEARIRGYKPGRFSFNVPGGRCEACTGDGVKKIEMHFLSDVYITCDVCTGKRYNAETLSVLYKGKNIADVLDMTVNQALDFFEHLPKIVPHLQVLKEVGLGYIKLGQSATTLSGGEAQRVKLAKELGRKSTGKTLYLLDEPTTGLHFEDINNLLEVLHKLVSSGNTVMTVEHNMDVIKVSDYIIDLGPEGGSGGGKVVCKGTPEDIAACNSSHTGRFLKKILNR